MVERVIFDATNNRFSIFSMFNVFQLVQSIGRKNGRMPPLPDAPPLWGVFFVYRRR
ncbi:hypothethical protein (plasmid) [Ralstonia solanacearum CMR15]|nr:hypothethical protein [Ralstonia solanacearum CMR15]